MAITLNTGDLAPNFSGIDQAGQTHTLAQYAGKKIVLFFYPADDTPGCTAETCSLRDSYADLTAKGVVLLGVSPDSSASHLKFAQKYNLPFALLADESKTILQAYGAWGEKNLYGKISVGVLRSTFLIDESGKIMKAIKRVDTKAAAAQLLKHL
jgi:thioredoxin-dependent peroxiredoxin